MNKNLPAQPIDNHTRRWYQSIKLEIGVSLLTIITVILTFFGIYQYRETRSQLLQELYELAEVMQERLGEYLVLPMWNMNFDLIEKIILSEMTEKRVHAILVKEIANETLLNGKIRDENWNVVDFADEKLSEDSLIRQRDILLDGEKLGSVVIYLTTQFMHAQLRADIRKTIMAIFVLDFALLFCLSLSLRRLLIRPITDIVAIARNIAAGDFQQTIEILRQNEIGDLARQFREMKDTINEVLIEQDAVNRAIQTGKLESRGNADAFSGKWRDLMVGVNNVIQACVTPINTTSDYLDRLSKGDIPQPLRKKYQGDFARIKNSLNVLIDATYQTTQLAEEISNGNLTVTIKERSENDQLMQALNRMIRRLDAILQEMDGLVRTVQEGKLDVRGNAGAFAGGWQQLVLGVNKVIDTFMQVTTLNERLKIENLRMSTEMELAQHIQTSLLPTAIEQIHPDFEIAAAMLPAEEVGGDYYDITFDPDGNLWFAIGDVAGHGVTPGLIMMMAQTIHTTIVTNNRLMPKDVVIRMNKVLYQNTHRLNADHFMTFTTLKYLGNGRFQHAGMHLDLIVYRQQSRTCELIDTDGAFLNFIEDISHATENAEFTLEIGDILILYSDGLTEAANAKKELFGLRRLLESVTHHAEKPPSALRDDVIQDVLAWCGDMRDDDMSIMVIRRISSPSIS